MSQRIDLGEGHWFQFLAWSPDRRWNPQYKDVPDEPRYGALVGHRTVTGEECCGGITFDTPTHRAIVAKGFDRARPVWTVHSYEPLTLSPSLICGCGDHGFIREGKWIRA